MASMRMAVSLHSGLCQSHAMRKVLALSVLCLSAAEAAAADFTSSYTSFDLDKCRQTEKPDGFVFEGSWRCKGITGYDILLGAADARGFAAFGAEAGNNCAYLKTFSGFNSFNSPVEFRYAGGKPLAAIQRWSVVANPETPEKTITWLVVNKLHDNTSCQMHYVAGSYPKANEAARRAADTLAQGFDCENGTPAFDSEIGPPEISLEPCSAMARE
jgi:hypothetical protein